MNVLIFGTFDRLHPGHEFVVTEALTRGSVTVIVARDANVRRIKGHKAEQSEDERMAAVVRVFPDVRVILGDPKDFLSPVREFKPDLILLGYDQQLPPGVSEEDLPCRVERLPAFAPERFKSSLRRAVLGEDRNGGEIP